MWTTCTLPQSRSCSVLCKQKTATYILADCKRNSNSPSIHVNQLLYVPPLVTNLARIRLHFQFVIVHNYLLTQTPRVNACTNYVRSYMQEGRYEFQVHSLTLIEGFHLGVSRGGGGGIHPLVPPLDFNPPNFNAAHYTMCTPPPPNMSSDLLLPPLGIKRLIYVHALCQYSRQ